MAKRPARAPRWHRGRVLPRAALLLIIVVVMTPDLAAQEDGSRASETRADPVKGVVLLGPPCNKRVEINEEDCTAVQTSPGWRQYTERWQFLLV